MSNPPYTPKHRIREMSDTSSLQDDVLDTCWDHTDPTLPIRARTREIAMKVLNREVLSQADTEFLSGVYDHIWRDEMQNALDEFNLSLKKSEAIDVSLNLPTSNGSVKVSAIEGLDGTTNGLKVKSHRGNTVFLRFSDGGHIHVADLQPK